MVTTITEILNQWYALGIFDYLLPFLLIFALVFGILDRIRILGDNKGVNAVIALTVGLLALLNDYVTNFFSIIFPYAGIALAILLVGLILFGLISDEHWSRWIWMIIGGISFVVVVWAALNRFSWNFGVGSMVLADLVPTIIILLIVVGAFLIIWRGSKKENKKPRRTSESSSE
jgi:hypothetical protein